MPRHDGDFEMRTLSKEALKESLKSAEKQHTTRPAGEENGRNLEEIVKIRRLFSFPQLFAFSLTFMSTWEGMNT